MIYCRFSTELQSPKSCDDQEREVRQGLERMGIDAAHAVVIHDEAQSGTKVLRGKFVQLETMLRAGEIGILAVDDQSRLSRGDNAFAFITDLVYAGGRFISTGEGIDTEQSGWELRVKVMELHNATTIRELGRRVRRGQLGRVIGNLSAGDLCYGYESYLVHPDKDVNKRGPKPERGVRIREEEALWVRQIFDWIGSGRSIAWIARKLTRKQVPGGSRRKSKKWEPRHVRKILGNEKYIGRWRWGVTRTRRDSQGKRKQKPVPVEQQVVTERPELRIVDDAAWSAAQEKLAQLKDIYGQKPGQAKRGPPLHYTELYPNSLLAGLVHCGVCGARLWQRRSGPRVYLGCPNSRPDAGGCTMRKWVPIFLAEQAVLTLLADVLSSWPEWLEQATVAMRQRLLEVARRVPEEVENDKRRLRSLEVTIKNLVDALAQGSAQSRAVTDRLEIAERETEQLRKKIARAEKLLQAPLAMPDDAWLTDQFRDLAEVFRAGGDQAIPLFRKLLGRIDAHAVMPPGKDCGYSQLRFRIDGWTALRCGLERGEKLDRVEALFENSAADSESGEFVIDLGGPTKMDEWAPQIAQWRAEGVKWQVIAERTGLDLNRAYRAWKRYVDANGTPSDGDPSPPPDSLEHDVDAVSEAMDETAAAGDVDQVRNADDHANDNADDEEGVDDGNGGDDDSVDAA